MKENKNNEYNIIGEVAREDQPGVEAFTKATSMPQFSHAAHCPTELIEKLREEYIHAPKYINNNKTPAQ